LSKYSLEMSVSVKCSSDRRLRPRDHTMKNYGIIPLYGIPTSRDLLFFDSFLSMGTGFGRQSNRG